MTPVPEHEVVLFISKITAEKKEVTVVSIDPLTNVAVALISEPRIADNVKRVVLTGGVTRIQGGEDLSYIEHNIRSDPEAAKFVF